MSDDDQIAKFVSGVKTEGFGFSPYSKKVIVLSQDTLTQEKPYQTVFDLNNASDCRKFLNAFLANRDIMVELSGKEHVIAKAIDTVAKAPDLGKKDLDTINKVVETGSTPYTSNRDISKALATMNQTADNRGLGKVVADNTMGALAQNRKRLKEAEEMR
jgi:hypothetical protein